MPVSALVTTPGSALANGYVTVAEADQYHLDRPAVGSTWALATTDQKVAAILWATKLMDSLWEWEGYASDGVQVLQWPRGGILKPTGWAWFDLNVIPDEIKDATAEYARQLLVSDRAGDSDIETQGILSLTAGPVSLTFKDSVTAKVVPDAVVNLIPPSWGYPRGGRMGYRNLQRA